MWHVTPGTRYLGQYMCVATNSVTTTETVHNFTGITRRSILGSVNLLSKPIELRET